MRVSSCARSIVTPARSALATWNRRSGPGTEIARSIAIRSSPCAPIGRSKPARPVSSERIALPSASRNVRPIAIASPTDFICGPRTLDADGNFSNANRGHLTTT